MATVATLDTSLLIPSNQRVCCCFRHCSHARTQLATYRYRKMATSKARSGYTRSRLFSIGWLNCSHRIQRSLLVNRRAWRIRTALHGNGLRVESAACFVGADTGNPLHGAWLEIRELRLDSAFKRVPVVDAFRIFCLDPGPGSARILLQFQPFVLPAPSSTGGSLLGSQL